MNMLPVLRSIEIMTLQKLNTESVENKQVLGAVGDVVWRPMAVLLARHKRVK
jgi:hypothetical protein